MPMADAWFSSKGKTFFCAEGQSHAEADADAPVEPLV
jgi:hypothetical protein